ncbi:MAG TPA: SGNH/GDSL hydrolase family protein [Gemmataceae bacterium]|nr:SGNH/GDSL hydrolase family protein [Gemmataceae bacterium]
MVRFVVIVFALAGPAGGADVPIPEAWSYSGAMKEVAANFNGRPGVVLHIGDSITYANPYGQWARSGKGQTPADKAVLRWMHTNTADDRDGWYLARADHPDGGRSFTACGGLRLDELLAGGKQKMPSLEALLDRYRPQAVVLLIGTNDASARRKAEAFKADFEKAVRLMTARGIVPVVSTVPPHVSQPVAATAINEVIQGVARDQKLPLIEFEREILARRPTDWNGTLLRKNDVHPSAEVSGVKPGSEPTAENLKTSGYLLRGWLSVRKVGEVKARVFD